MALNQFTFLRKFNLFLFFIINNTFLWVFSYSFISLNIAFNILIFLFLICKNKIFFNKPIILFTIFLLLHSCISLFTTSCETNFNLKLLFSTFYVILLILTINYFSKSKYFNTQLLRSSSISIYIMLFFLILHLLLSMFGIIDNYKAFGNNSFGLYLPFNEPSNFANAITSHLSIVFIQKPYFVIWTLIIVSYLSFTLAIAIYSSVFLLFINKLLAIVVCTLLIIIFFYNFGHIYNRINAFFDTQFFNLSTFVYLQGLVDTANHVRENLFGVGLNRMGCILEDNEYREIIVSKFPHFENLNRYDGSSAAFKLISEFGVFGIFFCIYLTVKYFKGLFFNIFKKSSSLNKKQLFLIFSIFYLIFILKSSSYFTNIIFILLPMYLLNQYNSKKLL